MSPRLGHIPGEQVPEVGVCSGKPRIGTGSDDSDAAARGRVQPEAYLIGWVLKRRRFADVS